MMKKNRRLVVASLFAGAALIAQQSCQSTEPMQNNEDIARIVESHYPEENGPGVSLLIKVDGRDPLLWTHGIGNLEENTPITKESRFRMASVSKQFTARAVFLLAERELLTMEDSLSQFFDDLPPAMRKLTLAQLLTHSSGIWEYETLIPENQREQISDRDVLDLIRTVDTLHFEPGTDFRYSNTGYCLLSLVVEQASGMPYADFMRQEMFEPLEMPNAQLFQADLPIEDRVFGYRPGAGGPQFADQSVTSATKGDGCVYISPSEYLRWFDHFIGNESYLERMETHKVPVKDGIFYGFGLFMATDAESGETRYIFHSGQTSGFRTVVYHDLKTRNSYVLFSNISDGVIGGAFDDLLKLYNQDQPATEGGNLVEWMSSVYDE